MISRHAFDARILGLHFDVQIINLRNHRTREYGGRGALQKLSVLRIARR